jgi:hypothetical protein
MTGNDIAGAAAKQFAVAVLLVSACLVGLIFIGSYVLQHVHVVWK